MPVALERKLKKEANKKGIKDKGAYVYGTLRKTGWKPKREKKMNDPSKTINLAELPNVGSSLERIRKITRSARNPFIKNAQGVSGWTATAAQRTKPWDRQTVAAAAGKNLPGMDWVQTAKKAPFQSSGFAPKLFNSTSKLIRLSNLDRNLDSVINFADDDDRFKSKIGGAVAAGGLVGGGYLGHRAIQQAGGYGAQWGAGKAAFGRGMAGTGLQGVAKGPGRFLGQYAGKAWGGIKGLLSKIKLDSKGKLVQMDEHILEPFGEQEKSKIAQEQFPAGISPAAALKMPFPELMKLLKGRNILQQQFSKLGKLVELGSRLDGIVKKQ